MMRTVRSSSEVQAVGSPIFGAAHSRESDGVAAVRRHQHSSDVGGFVAHEEQSGRGDLVRQAPPVHGDSGKSEDARRFRRYFIQKTPSRFTP